MQSNASLIKTSVELQREFSDTQACYYKLVIGTDPETKVVVTDSHLENLISNLPSLLSNVIQSQVFIETSSRK